MNETLRISGAAPARKSTDYAALREAGMAWIRLWAKDSWTDHNVHDPGITLLEACSYAMTELGLRLGLDMADLIKSGEARAAPALPPAHRVLPMGPVDTHDLRRVLLDHPLVSDAQIFWPAGNEVPFYADPGADPPLRYAPGTARVRTAGLYEVLVELADRELNTNTYALQVMAGGQPFDIELALPFWDDPEAMRFLAPATVTSVVMVDIGGPWRALPEAQSYFGRLAVSCTDAGGMPASVEMGVVLRVATPLQPAGNTPGVLAAARGALESIAAGAPLPRFALRVRSAASAVDALRTFLAGWRNLGEQAVGIGLARVQEVAVRATLEVTGGIDLELLVARIFMDIDALLSPRLRFESLAMRRAAQADPERIYDGPLLQRGFAAAEPDGAGAPAVVYSSDILRLILRRRSSSGTDLVAQENPDGRDIVAVTDLSLANFIHNRVITADAQDCLHLVGIERHRPRLSLAKSRIVALRNGAVLSPDPARVQALFAQLQAAALAEASALDTSPVWAVTRGEALPIDDYTPIQTDLPAVYGVGEAALADSVSTERRAAVKQLEGYLFPFEQMLGDVTAQLSNINRFFSGDADEPASYFVRAPFNLPGARALLRRFAAAGDWQAFVSDADNPVLQALHGAAEGRERLLDRRNRMLDHLLARQGEDTVALAQETLRWARAELAAAGLAPAQLEAEMAERLLAANARLLRLKAALLREVPELNGARLQATSNAFERDKTLLRIAPAGTGFLWFLAPEGTELLRAVNALPSAAAAGIAAEQAFHAAGRPANHQVVDVGGGQRRLQLFGGGANPAQAFAESTQSFGSVAAANAALPVLAAVFASLRLESSLSPLERRVALHTGIRAASRRRTLTAIGAFFEVFNEPAPAGLIGKRWRLRNAASGGGAVLLQSALRFDAATDPQAVALAEAHIHTVLRLGSDEWNYRTTAIAGGFAIELRDPAGMLLAMRGPVPGPAAAAEAALRSTVEHLVRHYAAEGLYLLEHLLLRPRRGGDLFLSLPTGDAGRLADPYSQRLSLVLASGLARDFAQPKASAATVPVTPHRFRDAEFRRQAEAVLQRNCPAHLLPGVFWVDRQAAGSVDSPASFDVFEDRYLRWLDTVLIPGATPADTDSVRNALVESLNAIANDAP